MTERKVQLLIEEMRANGNLPAISENVRDICNISRQSNSCAVDLAAIIMRDCGLTATILTTANSTLYSPRFPIKTVSYAVTFLGFEKVCSLALGLSLFKQTMESAHNQKLVHLYASSYFSGTFAMGLAREFKHKNPEEIFVAGLLYRLPWIALANTFPKRFQNMESLIHKGNLSYNEACLKVFDVEYTDICSGLVKVYNLPNNVSDVLLNRNGDDGMINSLVHQAGHIANMLFGDRLGGKDAISELNEAVRTLLHNENFSASDFIKDACKKDHNISRFFKLDKGDIDMMVNALEWGKGNPAQITSQSNFGQACDETVRSQEDPEQIIGHFLTELMLWHKRDIDVNQMLMLAQEAIFRCMSSPEVFTAFLNNEKSRLTGRFYAGNRADIKAEEFTIAVHDTDSPVIAALTAGRSGRWFIGEEALHLPGLKKHMNIKSALFSPITAANQIIGMYFVARTANDLFTEKEQAWLEQIADYVGKSFENMRKRHAPSEYMPEGKEQATESSAPPENPNL
ncbi:MAG: hypothetical protein A2017_12245 [Lentisphaerae bacterium GWF2_44_16]|nr:MAG: hypothetical protein A2017_12245 [Lentisphaerae bacterium GWF2_44_16]